MRNYKRTLVTVASFSTLLAVVFYLHPLPLLVSKQAKNLLLERAEEVNRERLGRVARVCSSYGLGKHRNNLRHSSPIKHPPTPQYGVFYIDKKDSLSYCPLYKAASTTWLFNLCLLGGLSEEELRGGKEQLSTIARRLYPPMEFPEAQEALESSLKLLVVRHPFERLLSAYRDKLENVNVNKEHGSEHFYKKYGSKIVKRYRGSLNTTLIPPPGTYWWDPRKPSPSGIEPTFKEFVRYLLETDLLNYSDDHWIPYYLFCTPCLIDYDLIGKVETLDLDQILAIERAQLSDRIFPRWQHKSSNMAGLSRIYFSQLTKKEVRQLYQKYKLDFELFGYSPLKYFQHAKG